jgi:hypothetical protein
MVIRCIHCGQNLGYACRGQRNLETVRALLSARCFCRQSAETLRGLLAKDAAALAVWRASRAHELEKGGLPAVTAQMVVSHMEILPSEAPRIQRALRFVEGLLKLSTRQETSEA